MEHTNQRNQSPSKVEPSLTCCRGQSDHPCLLQDQLAFCRLFPRLDRFLVWLICQVWFGAARPHFSNFVASEVLLCRGRRKSGRALGVGAVALLGPPQTTSPKRRGFVDRCGAGGVGVGVGVGESPFQGCSGGAGFCPSTVGCVVCVLSRGGGVFRLENL